MENATKALLIAAGVLIVILLIAFGMRIMNTSGGAASSAAQTGTQITTQTETAANTANKAMSDFSSFLGED